MFSKLDFSSGYWQIDMDKNNGNATAFVTHQKLNRYTKMLFGLKNAP